MNPNRTAFIRSIHPVPMVMSFNFAVWTAGFTSICIQILFMRELMSVFYGNELSLGIILGVWLFWTGMGSGPLANLFGKTGNPRRRFAWTLGTLALLAPATLVLIRLIRTVFGLIPGERIGLPSMLGIVFAVMPFFCVPSGLLYTYACALVSSPENGGRSLTRVYMLETLGSAAGGLACTLAFIPRFSAVETVCLLSLMSGLAAALAASGMPVPKKPKGIPLWIPAILVLGFICIRAAGPAQKALDRLLWRHQTLLEMKSTPYGLLAVVRTGEQTTFFESGVPLFTVPDPLTAEESVHYALFEHPSPRNVLLIGGGVAGGIGEVLKHPTVRCVDYVELDPEIVLAARRFLPPEVVAVLDRPDVRVHTVDGRRFIRTTLRKYDAVLLLLPDPYTAQLNRFYTRECFSQVDKILRPGGVFSLQIPSSENAIGSELVNHLASVQATLLTVFADVIVLPGETVRFIASNRKGVLDSDPERFIRRIRERNIQTHYFREYFLPYQLSKERREDLLARLKKAPRRINADFKPIGYVDDALAWASGFSSHIKPFYRFFLALHPAFLFAAAWACILLIFFCTKQRNAYTFLPLAVAAGGFTQIALEWILILAFQIIHGVAYQNLAWIIAGFMCGMTLGSAAAPAQKWRVGFLLAQTAMVLTPLAIRFVVLGSPESPLSGIGFGALTVWCGAVAGFHFTSANRFAVAARSRAARKAGMLYGMDLFGSALGAVLVSAFLVPVYGVSLVLNLIFWMNLGWLVVLLSLPWRRRKTPFTADDAPL